MDKREYIDRVLKKFQTEFPEAGVNYTSPSEGYFVLRLVKSSSLDDVLVKKAISILSSDSILGGNILREIDLVAPFFKQLGVVRFVLK